SLASRSPRISVSPPDRAAYYVLEGRGMGTTPDTRPSLLVRLRDSGDREAWRLFVDLYGPLVYALGRRHGLQDADAADLTQEGVGWGAGAVAVRSGGSAPRRGSFRGWLYRVAVNRLLGWRRRRSLRGSGDSAVQALLDGQPAPEAPPDDWDREYERRVFARAA